MNFNEKMTEVVIVRSGSVNLTRDYLQRVVSQDAVPEEKQLVGRQVARKASYHPFKGDA